MRQRGFSLLEMTLLVVIIAVAVGVVWPRYRAFSYRQQVDDALLAAAGAKNAVQIHYSEKGVLPDDRAVDYRFIGHRHVSAITIGAGGVITLTLNHFDKPGLDGHHLLLIPKPAGAKTLEWQCKKGDIPAIFLPEGCTP